MPKIHGKCSHFYCGHCTQTEEKRDSLDEGCKHFLAFHRNIEEYRKNKNKVVIYD